MTATPDEQRFGRATERMYRAIAVMAAAGALVLLFWQGWSGSAGWVLGCVASALNFHWLRRVTEALGAGEGTPRKAVFLGARYLLLGGGAYVILKYSAISLPAALAGLFVPAAAAIVEIVIELVYARN